MLIEPRFRLLCVAVLALGAIAAADARAENKGKRVQFDTSDGVEIEGTYYLGEPTKKKEAAILLLHDTDPKKGSNSHQDGWDHLAEALQAEGYSVLSFDFRGYGNSKNVKRQVFWSAAHNQMLKSAGAAKPPMTLDRDEFKGKTEYYPYLLNDIAAAKAFLDRRNDARDCNTSSLIVIGAGEGATLGAMWMGAEWHRQRATLDAAGRISRDPKTGKPILDEPEGNDQVCGIWLSISPKLGGRTLTSSMHDWLKEAVTADNKVKMAFVCGEKDEDGKSLVKKSLEAISEQVAKDIPSSVVKDNPNPAAAVKAKVAERMKLTEMYPIKRSGELTGSKLLDGTLDTEDGIKSYLEKVMDERGNKEAKTRDVKESAFLWSYQGAALVFPAKEKGEESPQYGKDVISRLLRGGG